MYFHAQFLVAVEHISNVRLAVFGIHGDCHHESVRIGLKKLCDAAITLSEPNYDGKGSAKCHISTYKTKSRNSRVAFNYSLSSSLEFVAIKSVNPENDIGGNDDANLETTFNLGLKLSEKKAKQQVELPFWRPEQKSSTNDIDIQSTKGSGEIIYIADETDDCDEEDPDDELNI